MTITDMKTKKLEWMFYLDVSMALEVKYGKAANITHAIYVDGKLPEEINDFLAGACKAQTEDQRS